ncbi:kinase-like protein [Dentipellis sp. KUC8613]|nr:kinase-like protein [Dentipellis sp. KUC8613]
MEHLIAISKYSEEHIAMSAENEWEAAGFDGPIFYKDKDGSEQNIYETLGPHPRIVKYLGSEPLNGAVMLTTLRNGSLFRHMRNRPGHVVPLATRLTWAVEIAQGLAHLHARDVIWADPHLDNVLLTDDYHAVLCDFGLSVHKAPYFYKFRRGPPPTYLCPIGYCVDTPRRTDIFGFGVMFFVLLTNRFPFHKDWFPSPVEEIAIMKRHNDIVDRWTGDFDKLPPALDHYFGNVLSNCFRIRYNAADTLAIELEAAFTSWWKENEQNTLQDDNDLPGVNIPYPRQPPPTVIEKVQNHYIMPELETATFQDDYDD